MLINAPDKPLRLKQTVAGNSPMDGGDAVAAKEALWRTGDYTPPFGNINDIPERELISGIRTFQQRNGLREDGEMNPNGPTERLLRASIGQSRDRIGADALRRIPIANTVGANGRNNPADKQTLKSMLTLTGQFDTDSPPEDEDFYLSAAIRNLQAEFNQPRTSLLTPGDESEKALRRSLDLNANGDPRDPYRTPLDRVQVAQANSVASDADNASEESPWLQVAQSDQSRSNSSTAKTAPAAKTGFDPFASAYPTDKSGFFEGNSYWDEFKGAVKSSGTSGNVANAFMEIFGREGGLRPDGDTVAGITKDAIANTITQTGISPGTLPKDLTMDQRVAVFREFLNLDEYFGSFGGIGKLDEIDDPKAAATLADTLFRHGSGEGTAIIQKSINDTAKQIGIPSSVVEDSKFGSRTFEQFRRLANDPKSRKTLLDNIAKRRIEKMPGEVPRARYFTIQ